jgi:hypothetical protein
MNEISKLEEVMVQGEDLDYTVVYIPSCQFSIEHQTYSYPASGQMWSSSDTITFKQVKEYRFRNEGVPFSNINGDFTEYEALIMIRPKKRG